MVHYRRELLRLLPRVLRARDFHLYLEGGKRLTDLWRSGGKAVLGHKPPRVLGELKNAAERGLFTPLPHPMEKRFVKALAVFFPGRSFRLYADESSLFQALEAADFTGPIYDPAFPSLDSGAQLSEKCDISFWRPFLDDDKKTPVLVPVLPWPLGPAVLVLEEGMVKTFPQGNKSIGTEPQPANSAAGYGELISPVLLAPAARALHDLAAELKNHVPNRPRFLKIEKILKDSPWRRRGIYLTGEPDMNSEKYEALFRRFLEGGFLIPPSPLEPLILPFSMSSGEESKLAELLKS